MSRAPHYRAEESTLRQLHRVKQIDHPRPAALGGELIQFFKHGVEKRQSKFEGLSDCWSRLIPEMINQHCCLESFHRGTLTVLVDTAAHLYELRQLLSAGLQKQLLAACKGAGLRKIMVKRGAWYDGDARERKLRFS